MEELGKEDSGGRGSALCGSAGGGAGGGGGIFQTGDASAAGGGGARATGAALRTLRRPLRSPAPGRCVGQGRRAAPLSGAFPAAGLPGGALAPAGSRSCQNKALSLNASRRVREMVGRRRASPSLHFFSFPVHLK